MNDFAAEARNLGFELAGGQLAAFALYRDHIIAATRRFNLTSVRDPVEIERRHFLESLAFGGALVAYGVIPGDGGVRALDLGAGAGVPGLPLKIAWPLLRLALLESNQKRCQFLRETLAALGLAEAEVLEGRAEAWARDATHRGAYDLVFARAVAPFPVLLEYALPFLRLDGILAAPKGSRAIEELVDSEAALKELGGTVITARAFSPPHGRPQTLVLVRKSGQTPERYPRRPGVPARRPLVGP